MLYSLHISCISAYITVMGWCTNALTLPGRCSGNTHVQVIRAGSPHLHSRRELEFMGCCKKLFWWYRTKKNSDALHTKKQRTQVEINAICQEVTDRWRTKEGKRLLGPPPPVHAQHVYAICLDCKFSICNRAGNFVKTEKGRGGVGVKGEQKQGLLRLKEREGVERVCPAGSKQREREKG